MNLHLPIREKIQMHGEQSIITRESHLKKEWGFDKNPTDILEEFSDIFFWSENYFFGLFWFDNTDERRIVPIWKKNSDNKGS